MLPAEIISADAVQVYKGLNIGSAKPEPHIQAKVKHHLIDIAEPNTVYSAGRFVEDAHKAIADVVARHKVPLVVGGTMFYVKALLQGLNDLPRADKSIRAKYMALAQQGGTAALHAVLLKVDPEAAQRIGSGDEQRLCRALELNEQVGMPLSSLFDKSNKKGLKELWESEQGEDGGRGGDDGRGGHGGRGEHGGRGGRILTFALMFAKREQLHKRLAVRFRQFIANGLLEEVKALSARGDLDLTYPAMRAVGYRQVWEYLEQQELSKSQDGTDGKSQDKHQDKHQYDEMIEKGIIATRQLAKKQITWLSSWDNLHILDASLSSDKLAKQIIKSIL